MSRIAKLGGIVLASGLVGSAALPANAQLAAHKDLTLNIALTMAQTASAMCTGQGYKVSVHVLGRDGEVLVAMRGDGANPHTMENSMRKAYTSRMQRRPSGEFADAAKKNPTAGALHLDKMIPAQGALPITVDGDTIGAIGVSGSPGGDKDEACAKAGIDKVSAQLK
jgi:uncharacterized protein GlcG (DUF336 family)